VKIWINQGLLYVTHTLHTVKITYSVWLHNNFEFTFQLMTIGLLSTAEFHNEISEPRDF